jgi:predicted flap endonuclease-1-like 5' DNA nuclease
LPIKFHLEPTSHVEAAPTIGPRMAERLEAIGIVTVSDLFASDAEDVATRLKHRRTTSDVVRQWQRQAELVCRIPQIRGHDAQILVACEITSPEQIAALEPDDLLAIVEPLCSGPEGKRLLRNNKRPDLAEITEWIAWAKRARQLEAA